VIPERSGVASQGAGIESAEGVPSTRSARSNTPEAVAECKEALRLRLDDPAAHDNLGLAQSALGKHAEAAAKLRAALRLRPDFAGRTSASASRGAPWASRPRRSPSSGRR
jgi:tetratricopeptide (TPR) repeat protein